MSKVAPTIDKILFERHVQAFVDFVEHKSGVKFGSFTFNPYFYQQEGYKHFVHHEGRAQLDFATWSESQIGSGVITHSVISALKVRENNLVSWRVIADISEAFKKPDLFQPLERILFDLYRCRADQQAFEALTNVVGQKYSLIAYLFFLKDRSKYLPIATRYFDQALGYLGADFQTSHRCSWDNYQTFLQLVAEVRTLLHEYLRCEVTLLDAHSFIWMLSKQMQDEGRLPSISGYQAMSPTEKDALSKARIGQGPWRDKLLRLWHGCAVMDFSEEALLTASHIKPWAKCNDQERLDVANGFPLSPALNACFDKGLISFTDEGRILISPSLLVSDVSIIGIHSELRLRRIDDHHKKYLAYHRKEVFRQANNFGAAD
ncbi:MAG: hypothetical protein DCF15_20230 [Phormidesmis priestleyi]|uniref:HNH nuclease domain-containing protein n=1 Tax=Phormidesmis priestleyi TaxID=268141 RepID=A0A2W4YGY3_9CYAN|nr:MAG: hypothetical protein DCF15_20230 [Phormidesmis priestleyi]